MELRDCGEGGVLHRCGPQQGFLPQVTASHPEWFPLPGTAGNVLSHCDEGGGWEVFLAWSGQSLPGA